MTPIEKTKLQFDLQKLNDLIQKSRCSRNVKDFAENVIERAEKAMDLEATEKTTTYPWKGTDL